MDAGNPFYGFNLRQRPANLMAEHSVLGGLMASPKALEQVADFLQPEHFSDPLHGRIYAEIRRRIVNNEPTDAIALKVWFDADPNIAEAGADYLSRLVGAYIGPGTCGPYAKLIHEAWMRRSLIDLAEQLADKSFGNDITPPDIISETISKLDNVLGLELERKAVSLDAAVADALQAADDASKRQGPAGLSTGFPSIDERMGGLEDGTLNVLAARPGMGKTALANQIGLAVARAGIGVCMISLEMSARELARRVLASIAGVPVLAMKRGKLTEQQAMRLVAAQKELAGLPTSIEDSGGLTAAMIDIKLRAAHRRHGVGLLIVDHLHIVRPEDADLRSGATWAVGRISNAMKRAAKRHNIPVLLLAQLNRGPENRDDKRPTLADLRQTGDIEQDADTVAFLYRAEYYLRDPERTESDTPEKFQKRCADHERRKHDLAGKAELIFAKIRDGDPGTVNLRFHGETTSFSEALNDG